MTDANETKQQSVPFITSQYGRSQEGKILLYSGNLQLTMHGQDPYLVQGGVSLTLGPRSSLDILITRSDARLTGIVSGERPEVVEVPQSASLEPPALLSATEPKIGDAEAWKAEFWINSLDAGDLANADHLVLYITGSLTQWPLPRVDTMDGTQGQVSLTLPGWGLRLAAIDQLAPETELSFSLLAVPVSLPMEIDEVKILIRRVHMLMQFLGAGAVSIAPRTAEDEAGQIVWAQWAAPLPTNQTGLRWCTDELVITALPILASGLTEVTQTPGLEACLDRAIALWNAANGSGPIDVRIPTACSGLELLAWSVLQHQQWLTPESLGKMSASSMTRLLLQWAGIPVELPAHLDSLTKRRGSIGQQGIAGPELVFNVRNRLVHPPRKLTDPEWPTPDELIQCWQLATWYLELAILRVLGYAGRYSNRLRLTGWAGETDDVPWRLGS